MLSGSASGRAVRSEHIDGLNPEHRLILLIVCAKELTLQDSDAVAAALAQYRRRPRLHCSDRLILEVARTAGHLPLGTFDRDLGKVAGAESL
jgi:predicted nucleic acid-binding protein